MGLTLLEKVWESHVVSRGEGGPDLLYVDLHLVHEVTSPQAFEGLRLAGRRVRRPDLTLATMDHNVATGDDTPPDPLSHEQLETLRRNCEEFGVPLYATGSGREGIVHVIGPERVEWERALDRWRSLPSDPGAHFDREVEIDAGTVLPQVTWGTNPGMVVSIDGSVPDPASLPDAETRAAAERALVYMGLEPGTPIREIEVDRVFIGSCTNSRIEDLRAAAAIVRGRQVHPSVRAMVVPGSAQVKRQAEDEGLDRVFTAAGFEWRRAGCSMCLGMNPDVLAPGERCASTSNRNFEGRQGAGGRTHLVSPLVAAATALQGRSADAREPVPA